MNFFFSGISLVLLHHRHDPGPLKLCTVFKKRREGMKRMKKLKVDVDDDAEKDFNKEQVSLRRELLCSISFSPSSLIPLCLSSRTLLFFLSLTDLERKRDSQ